MATAILMRDVSKKFILHRDRPRSIQETFLNLLRLRGNGRREEFWALRDISFTVEQGEAVGIIGPNGSGKSTLLKLIARILEPTMGHIAVNGRISALLELGAGFHPDLTGRENIFLSGSILGLSRRDVEHRLDSIIEFADIGSFIDIPVRHYSSGMFMRLGFAIAINVEPDILLIDEILAVGDEAFQRKCLDKIGAFKRSGHTILFVSHDLDAVRFLCDWALWIEKGIIRAQGETKAVVDSYLQEANIAEKKRLDRSEGAVVEVSSVPATKRWGSYDVEITQVEFTNGSGKRTTVFRTGETMVVRIHYHAHQRIENVVFGVGIHRSDGFHISGPNTKFADYPIHSIEGKGVMEFVIPSLPLLAGEYEFSCSIYDESCTHPYDHHDRAYVFKIRPGAVKEKYGCFYIPCQWQLLPQEGERGAK